MLSLQMPKSCTLQIPGILLNRCMMAISLKAAICTAQHDAIWYMTLYVTSVEPKAAYSSCSQKGTRHTHRLTMNSCITGCRHCIIVRPKQDYPASGSMETPTCLENEKRSKIMPMYLTHRVVPSCWQVSDLDCQVWGISTKLGGLAGEHLGKGSACYALLVLIHALVKQEPAHNHNIACLADAASLQ